MRARRSGGRGAGGGGMRGLSGFMILIRIIIKSIKYPQNLRFFAPFARFSLYLPSLSHRMFHSPGKYNSNRCPQTNHSQAQIASRQRCQMHCLAQDTRFISAMMESQNAPLILGPEDASRPLFLLALLSLPNPAFPSSPSPLSMDNGHLRQFTGAFAKKERAFGYGRIQRLWLLAL